MASEGARACPVAQFAQFVKLGTDPKTLKLQCTLQIGGKKP